LAPQKVAAPFARGQPPPLTGLVARWHDVFRIRRDFDWTPSSRIHCMRGYAETDAGVSDTAKDEKPIAPFIHTKIVTPQFCPLTLSTTRS
jgi:hypothetical protein